MEPAFFDTAGEPLLRILFLFDLNQTDNPGVPSPQEAQALAGHMDEARKSMEQTAFAWQAFPK